MQELPQAAARIASLKTDGGHAITHIVRIARQDGKAFSIRSMERVVHDLHRFLSFARGLWTSLFGVVGFNAQGDTVFEDWGTRLTTPWQSMPSWFDIHHGECLAEAYPGFVNLLHDANLGPSAYAALYWYLRSNRAGDGAGVDSGLILSQAALERLSLACLENNALPTNGNAADRLRRACRLLKLPIAVPQEATRLRYAKKKKAFADAPEAIVALRNELIHPKRRLAVPMGPLVPQGWKLAQWYVELFLLRLAGYRGMYSDRIAARWVGEVKPVPWAK